MMYDSNVTWSTLSNQVTPRPRCRPWESNAS